MSEPIHTSRRFGGALGVVVGVLAGVLVSAIVIPDHSTRVVQTGAGRSAGDDSLNGAPTDLAGAPVEGASTAQTAAAGQAVGTRSPAGGRTSGAGAGVSSGAATGGGGAAAATKARGVTDNKIRIGIGIPDISVIAALGPGYDQGDGRQHAEAMLDGWKKQGLVPVNGRDVEFVYRTYNILSAEEARAACVGFVQDDKVFAVVAIHNFVSASECVAGEFKTPLITANGPGDDVYVRSHPFLFTMEMSASRLLRNFAHWADRHGVLKGKKIGLYHADDPAVVDSVNRDFVNVLKQLGYSITERVTTTVEASATGGPQDTVAVQRFQTAGVNLAILLVSAVAKTNFFQQAEAQGYRPAYIDNDLGFSTTNTATSTYPPAHYNGTLAMTGQRFGESRGGFAPPPEATVCIQNYERFSGKKVDRDGREAEWIATNQLCDEGRVLLYGLQQVGRDLTPLRLVGTLETIHGWRMGIHGDVTYTPTKHHGVDTQRTLQWEQACKCWKALGAVEPLYVP